jgi:hypothetical protein
MLAEKIARARQAKRHTTLRFLIIISVAVLLAALLLYLSSRSDWLDTAEPIATDKPDGAISAESPAPTETPETEESGRESYLEAYAHYQNQLKPQLNKIDIKSWDPAFEQQLKQDETAAIEAFSAGEYAQANRAIESLTTRAENFIENSRRAFSEAIANAEQAYQALDYDRARLEVDKALVLDGAAERAQLLSEKVEQIPQIVELEKAIAVAKAENNPARELELIKALLQLDAQREVQQQRAATLQSQLTGDRYQQHIANGYRALEQRNLQKAKAELAQARKLYTGRQENQQLAAAIAELESSLVYESSVTAANQAQQADNWQTAVLQWKEALAQRPADKQLSNKLATAERIVSLQQQMQDLLAKPYRLANELVKSKAEIALIQAEPVRGLSPSLNAEANKLRDTVNAVNKPVTVEVVSDGQTAISVRGVGVVGTTQSKKIELKPGRYFFEGKRQGYKSKIVEVTVPLGTASYQVSIVADERI